MCLSDTVCLSDTMCLSDTINALEECRQLFPMALGRQHSSSLDVVALSNPKTSILIQKCPFYSGNLNSESPGNSVFTLGRCFSSCLVSLSASLSLCLCLHDCLLSTCPSICLCVCLPACPSVHVCMAACRAVLHLSVRLIACMPFHLPASLFDRHFLACLPACLSVCLTFSLSACTSATHCHGPSIVSIVHIRSHVCLCIGHEARQ